MNYSSVRVFESKTQPGARVVLKRMNDRRRQRVVELQAESAAKVRAIFEEFAPLNDEYVKAWRVSRLVGAAERKAAIAGGASEKEAFELHPVGKLAFSDEQFRKWMELREKIKRVERNEMEPIALKCVVERIEDFEIDGQPVPSIDGFLAHEDAPDDFWEEMSREVKRELGLLGEEAENLGLPSTSAAAVGGANPTGNAEAAGTTATTTRGAVVSITDPVSVSALSIELPR